MNYYERHLGDYAKDAGHLDMLEHGAYGLLLDRYYTTEEPIPAGDIYRVTRAKSKTEKDAVNRVLSEFFRLVDGLWINKRADQEIERFRDKQAKAKASADARWAKHKPSCETDANAMRTHSEGNAPRARSSHQSPDSKRNLSSGQAPNTSEEGAPWSPETSPAWAAFEAHHQQTRKWSLPRAHQAKGQLRAIAKDGGNPEAVLEWALTRGLSDLTDCARRMAADAAKESENAERRRSGESLADASRRITEERKLGPSPTALIPLAGPGNAG